MAREWRAPAFNPAGLVSAPDAPVRCPANYLAPLVRDLTLLERHWRDALLAAMIPPSEAGRLPGLGALDLTPFWLTYREAAPPLLRIGFRLAVLALTWLPVMLHGRPFHRLPPDDQDRFLTRMAVSRSYVLRQLVTVVKLIACFAYGFDPAIQRAIREAGR